MTKRTFFEEISFKAKQPSLNKRNTLADYKKQIETAPVFNARCKDCLIMSNEEFTKFSNTLLTDYKFVEELVNGTGSDAFIEGKKFGQYTREEMAKFMELSYRVVTMVFNVETNEKFYICNDGYSYARYVLFEA